MSGTNEISFWQYRELRSSAGKWHCILQQEGYPDLLIPGENKRYFSRFIHGKMTVQ